MIRNILVPVDLRTSTPAQGAADRGQPAETFEARLHLITVVPEFGLPMVGQFFPAGYEAKLRQHAASSSRNSRRPRGPTRSPTGGSSARADYQEILKAAAAIQVDLIVMGSHRRISATTCSAPTPARWCATPPAG